MISKDYISAGAALGLGRGTDAPNGFYLLLHEIILSVFPYALFGFKYLLDTKKSKL